MKIINIIPADKFEDKSYKNSLSYAEGDDRMLVGEVSEMIESIKAELGNVKLAEGDEQVDGEFIGWVICMWPGGASYQIFKMAEVAEESKEQVAEMVEVINPKYASMSVADAKAAEQNYDNVNNEGGEGYNPYRDNLTVLVKKEEEKTRIKLVNSFHNTEIFVDAEIYVNKYDRAIAEITPEDLAAACESLCGSSTCTCHKYESNGYGQSGNSYMICIK